MTAALEHFTATLAEMILSDPEARDMFGDETVKNLFLWHALEEAEHKAVAFDVYKADRWQRAPARVDDEPDALRLPARHGDASVRVAPVRQGDVQARPCCARASSKLRKSPLLHARKSGSS